MQATTLDAQAHGRTQPAWSSSFFFHQPASSHPQGSRKHTYMHEQLSMHVSHRHNSKLTTTKQRVSYQKECERSGELGNKAPILHATTMPGARRNVCDGPTNRVSSRRIIMWSAHTPHTAKVSAQAHGTPEQGRHALFGIPSPAHTHRIGKSRKPAAIAIPLLQTSANLAHIARPS